MKAVCIKAVAPCEVVLEEMSLDDSELAPNEVLIRSQYSLTNTGTELARFAGLAAESSASFKYPFTMGWANVGTVENVGSAVEFCAKGDLVLGLGPHASVFGIDESQIIGKVPSGIDPRVACYARMAAVSISAVRKAEFGVGESVLVIGQGIVGNLAAQLFAIAGAEVMVADVIEPRLQVARECGITHAVNPLTADLKDAVTTWTEGKGPQIVVEAVGDADLICLAVNLVAARGQVVLLGTPRKRKSLPMTQVFARVHMHDITVNGAYLFDVPRAETEYVRHSIRGNVQQIFGWLRDGRLRTQPLQTLAASPQQCQQAYEQLNQHRDRYQVILFDWGEAT